MQVDFDAVEKILYGPRGCKDRQEFAKIKEGLRGVGIMIDNGRMMAIEFSPDTARWEDIPDERQKLHQDLVRMGKGKVTSVLAQHKKLAPGVAPDPINDVQQFSVRVWEPEGKDDFWPVGGRWSFR
jgi:hypothetical protein